MKALAGITIALAIAALGFLALTPQPAQSQGAGFRYQSSGYGGSLYSSLSYVSFNDCEAARAETFQGWPQTACRPTLGQ